MRTPARQRRDALLEVCAVKADLAHLKKLRELGVKSYSLDGLVVEFFPIAPEASNEKPSAPVEEACRCGHEWAAHADGLCLHACDVSKCAPPE